MRSHSASLIANFDDLQMVMRSRADDLQISRLEIDRLGELPPGYASKLLSDPPVKRLGPKTLAPMLRALGLKLVAIDDPDATIQTILASTSRKEGQCRHDREGVSVRHAEPPPEKVPAGTEIAEHA